MSKIQLDELIFFSKQMSLLIKAGVPIQDALAELTKVTTGKLQSALKEINSDLMSGKTLNTCFKRQKDFPRLFIAMLDIGESTGQIAKAFEMIENYLVREKQRIRQIKSALRYPIIVVIAIFFAFITVNVFVIPPFQQFFDSMSISLPIITRIMLGISGLITNYWPLLSVILVVLIFSLLAYIKSPAGRYYSSYYMLKIPLLGGILKRAYMGRFCHSLSVVLSSGVPILESLSLISKSVNNHYVEKCIIKIRDNLSNGESFLTSAQKSRLFDGLVLQMISVGDKTGELDKVLLQVATYYEQDVDFDIKRLAALLEPVLIVCVAGLVLCLALGVFLPMWELSSSVAILRK